MEEGGESSVGEDSDTGKDSDTREYSVAREYSDAGEDSGGREEEMLMTKSQSRIPAKSKKVWSPLPLLELHSSSAPLGSICTISLLSPRLGR